MPEHTDQLLAEIRDLLARQARRPLGPHSYVSEEEAAAETGHGIDTVRATLLAHRGEVPHQARVCGAGEIRRWRWLEAQDLLARHLGGQTAGAASKGVTEEEIIAARERANGRRWERARRAG